LTGSPESLETSLGYRFDDPNLLKQALTHCSAGSRNNERLEFLGDALLGCVIAGELFERHRTAREGDLSRLRASLVRRESLADLAVGLDIGRHLRLGAGERKSGGHRRYSILADALEAVFGAVYVDGGFDACRKCILQLFADRLAAIADAESLKDAKTRLQEFLQARQMALPEYTVIEESGDAHARSFRVQCQLADSVHAPTQGSARSRRQAEQKAAASMLEQLENAGKAHACG
jgi:ribonuclease-3